MKKLAVGAVLGMGMLLATATPAMAGGYVYTGKWYSSAAACEKAWENMTGGGASLGHQCRYNKGGNVYELWAYRL
ncbi:hypothetical protein ACL03H_15840 [Saccharopolyspora sp. MS10]|uniref:hypothetical protein n=1 Tax=Saccharopolyspora sp. MS10 TaxID=3385973 RepID=UPI0039A01C61